jgi:integrase
MRRGELCGLRWSSVDLDAAVLLVEHTRTSLGGKVVEGTGKSEHSRAAVDLDPASVAMLRAYRTRQSQQRLMLGEAWQAGELVFVRVDGVPWRPDYVSRELDRLVGV